MIGHGVLGVWFLTSLEVRSSSLRIASDASSALEMAQICVRISLCQSDAVLIRLRKNLGGGGVAFVLTMVSCLSVQAPISASTSCSDTPAVDWLFSSASSPLCLSCWPVRSASVNGIVVCDSFLPTACFVAASSTLLPSVAAPCSKEPNLAFRPGSCEISIWLC